MNSALYEGTLRHRRLSGPVADELRQRLFMTYLDLDELPELFDRRLLWSARRPALAWFRREDHLGDPRIELGDVVRDRVAEQCGRRPAGPIRLLTHLRYLGHCFNPVSFYYCFDPSGLRVEAVLAHVTNTPWGESHSYVLPVLSAADHGSARVLSGNFEKQLHVSPLMGMNHVYEMRLTEPSKRLSVHICSSETSGESNLARPVFDATLSLARREMNSSQMARMLARYPLLTARILARIYAHALSLRLRGAVYHPHPPHGALSA